MGGFEGRVLLLGLLVACTPVEQSSDMSVSFAFRDFPAGTVCSVQTYGGTLSLARLPGRIDNLQAVDIVDVTCRAEDGAVFYIDTASVLTSGGSEALVTAYGTGLLTADLSPGGAMPRNPTGVQQR